MARARSAEPALSARDAARLPGRTQTTIVHGLALIPACAYGVYHALYENPAVATFSLLACVVIVASWRRALRGQDNRVHKLLFCALLTAELVLTSYHFGYRGLILVFPLTASFLFLMRFGLAVTASLVAIGASLAAALHVVDVAMAARFGVALLLSTAFSAAFAYSLNRQKDALREDIHRDFLTGVSNRRGFIDWMNRNVRGAGEASRALCLFYIDVDDFKRINDTYGHATGDELLSQFSRRVLSCIRDCEKIPDPHECANFGRLAGDEFALALLELDDAAVAEIVAQRIIQHVASPFNLNQTELTISVSIGILYTTATDEDAETLLARADQAMYSAKQLGKNQCQFFDADLAAAVRDRKQIEIGLRKALAERAFHLVFMPIFDCQTLRITAAEALLRCDLPELAEFGPDQYIPVAEQHALIRDVDQFVLELALETIARERDALAALDVLVAVNLSAQALRNKHFPEVLGELLARHAVAPTLLELEITETRSAGFDALSIETLNRLKALGIRLSLDDFGTGYTGFNQLMNYPVDRLKIDRSFIEDLTNSDGDDRAITDVVLAVAAHYGLDVVAEGVETQAQLDYLRERGCGGVQGYLLSRPVAFDEFLALCRDGKQQPATSRFARQLASA